MMRFVWLGRCVGIGTAGAECGFWWRGRVEARGEVQKGALKERWLFDAWRHDV